MNKLRKSDIDVEQGVTPPKSDKPLIKKELQLGKEPQSVDNSHMDQSTEEAPNISLNLHSESGILELALYAFLGIILQAGVLAFSGFVAYHPYLKTKLRGPNASVGFPLQAAGTTFLVASMILCSFVVDQSTEEKRWVAKFMDETSSRAKNANSSSGGADPTDGKKLRILWLQKRNFVGDQGFDSFFLMAKKECDEIRTSRRSKLREADAINKTTDAKDRKRNVCGVVDESVRKNYLGVSTILGIVFGIFGFVAQFEGFRLSNWSSTIAQLVAVFLMTILRAVVRRGLTKGPANKKLPENYEMDWLALEIADKPDFLRKFGGSKDQTPSVPTEDQDPSARTDPTWYITIPHPGSNLGSNLALRSKRNLTKPPEKGQRAMKIRQRLGQLTRWAGPASKEAITVANAIEVVMKRLPFSESQEKFIWSLNVNVGEREPSKIELTVEKDTGNTNPKSRGWKADAMEIEAALSLWSYHFRNQYDGSKIPQPKSEWHDWLRPAGSMLARPCRRVLGQYSGALHRDLAWWIGDGVAQESRTRKPN
jgi:hypothetical protein